MEEAGLDFRATKDLDIVLCIEALNSEFVKAFWEFIKMGKYRIQEKSTGKKLFYPLAPKNTALQGRDERRSIPPEPVVARYIA